MTPPSAICCSIWPEIPAVNNRDRKRSGSISETNPSRLRRTSHQPNPAMATTPTTNSPSTASPPSCQTRMLSTIPPIPTTESTAPVQSTPGSPVYGVSRTSLIPSRTTAITTSSRRNAILQDR